jgi:hypothetical protein
MHCSCPSKQGSHGTSCTVTSADRPRAIFAVGMVAPLTSRQLQEWSQPHDQPMLEGRKTAMVLHLLITEPPQIGPGPRGRNGGWFSCSSSRVAVIDTKRVGLWLLTGEPATRHVAGTHFCFTGTPAQWHF